MKFLHLQPFVPAGKHFEKSKELFVALGFKVTWEGGGYAGFQRDNCKFILQEFYMKDFAENFMITVNVDSADEFYKEVKDKKLEEQFGIKMSAPKDQPYGREVNIIDIAGVCWHFVEPPAYER
jgi:hypothetical protein